MSHKRDWPEYWNLSDKQLFQYWRHWHNGRAANVVLQYIRAKAQVWPVALKWEEVIHMWQRLGLEAIETTDRRYLRKLHKQYNAECFRKWKMPELTLRAASLLWILENKIDLHKFALESFPAENLILKKGQQYPTLGTKRLMFRRCRTCKHRLVEASAAWCNESCRRKDQHSEKVKRRARHCATWGCKEVFFPVNPQRRYCTPTCQAKKLLDTVNMRRNIKDAAKREAAKREAMS